MSLIKHIDNWLQTGLLGNNGPMEVLDEVALQSDQNNINSLQQNLSMGNTTPVTNNVPPPQPPNFMNGSYDYCS
jgi:hypothetical protein